MKQDEEAVSALVARRAFLRKIGGAAAATCVGTGVGAGLAQKADAKGEAAAERGPVPDYDWGAHRWGFGVDATKCIGCLRCVEA